MRAGVRATRSWQIFCTVSEVKMAYFPFFYDLKDKEGVVIGGGRIALEKVEKLTSFEARLTVIAPEILPQIRENKNVRCLEREYVPGDIIGADYCIAATDDERINSAIHDICRENKVLINVVDDREKCDFIFPSVIKRGDLVVGVSSSGTSPYAAVLVRKRIEEIIPENIEDILKELNELRARAVIEIPDDKKRKEYLIRATGEAFEKAFAREM